VLRWVNAFNARDLDGVLSCFHPDADFHPLKMMGINSSYRGHDGVRRWFDKLDDLRYEHRIDLSEIRDASESQLLAIGALRVGEYDSVAPFCAFHRIEGELIVAARHHCCDGSLMEQAGLIS
jgi:hypothetical protein